MGQAVDVINNKETTTSVDLLLIKSKVEFRVFIKKAVYTQHMRNSLLLCPCEKKKKRIKGASVTAKRVVQSIKLVAMVQNQSCAMLANNPMTDMIKIYV